MVLSSIKEKISAWRESPAVRSFKSLFPLICALYPSSLSRRFIFPISIAFSGRVGTKELAAVGISNAILVVTAAGTANGLTISFEKMSGQSYGERDYHNVGVLLQKAFLFSGFLCTLVAALWLHSGAILAALGVPPDVAALTELYLIMYIPAMIGIVVFRVQRGYLVLLRHILPATIVSVVGVALLIAINFLFMNVFHMGTVGVAICNDITNVAEILAIFLYIIISGIYKETWPGFSKKCFLDWESYLLVAAPGAFSFFIKATVHEIALISIGSLGDVQVAAQSTLFTVLKLGLPLAFAVGLPTNVNISKHFGEGNANDAKITAIVGFLINATFSVIIVVCLVAAKDSIGPIFTHDPEVLRLVSKILPYTAFTFLTESVTTVLFIMCVALNLQAHSIIIYAISCLAIGLTTGITLALHFKDITLLWCGLLGGFLIQLFMYGILFWWKVDFEKITAECHEQRNGKASKSAQSSGYVPVNTSDCSDREEVELRRDVKHKATEIVIDSNVDQKQCIPSSEQHVTGDDEEVTSKLIVKRLFTLGISVAILAISIALKLYFK